MVLSSNRFRTSPFQGGDEGFESPQDYQGIKKKLNKNKISACSLVGSKHWPDKSESSGSSPLMPTKIQIVERSAWVARFDSAGGSIPSLGSVEVRILIFQLNYMTLL